MQNLETISLSEIKIPYVLSEQRYTEKLAEKRLKQYRETGQMPGQIIIDYKNALYDGYANYLAAKELGLTSVEIIRRKDGASLLDIQKQVPIEEIIVPENCKVSDKTINKYMEEYKKNKKTRLHLHIRPDNTLFPEYYALYLALRLSGVEVVDAIVYGKIPLKDIPQSALAEPALTEIPLSKIKLLSGKSPENFDSKIIEALSECYRQGKKPKHPLVITSKNVLVDGYQRYFALKAANIKSVIVRVADTRTVAECRHTKNGTIFSWAADNIEPYIRKRRIRLGAHLAAKTKFGVKNVELVNIVEKPALETAEMREIIGRWNQQIVERKKANMQVITSAENEKDN